MGNGGVKAKKSTKAAIVSSNLPPAIPEVRSTLESEVLTGFSAILKKGAEVHARYEPDEEETMHIQDEFVFLAPYSSLSSDGETLNVREIPEDRSRVESETLSEFSDLPRRAEHESYEQFEESSPAIGSVYRLESEVLTGFSNLLRNGGGVHASYEPERRCLLTGSAYRLEVEVLTGFSALLKKGGEAHSQFKQIKKRIMNFREMYEERVDSNGVYAPKQEGENGIGRSQSCFLGKSEL